MSIVVMIVVLLAALLHASWNFFVENTDDKPLSMSAVVVGHAPFALAAILISPFPDIKSLPYIFAGALLHVGYQLFLLASYRLGMYSFGDWSAAGLSEKCSRLDRASLASASTG